MLTNTTVPLLLECSAILFIHILFTRNVITIIQYNYRTCNKLFVLLLWFIASCFYGVYVWQKLTTMMQHSKETICSPHIISITHFIQWLYNIIHFTLNPCPLKLFMIMLSIGFLYNLSMLVLEWLNRDGRNSHNIKWTNWISTLKEDVRTWKHSEKWDKLATSKKIFLLPGGMSCCYLSLIPKSNR